MYHKFSTCTWAIGTVNFQWMKSTSTCCRAFCQISFLEKLQIPERTQQSNLAQTLFIAAVIYSNIVKLFPAGFYGVKLPLCYKHGALFLFFLWIMKDSTAQPENPYSRMFHVKCHVRINKPGCGVNSSIIHWH